MYTMEITNFTPIADHWPGLTSVLSADYKACSSIGKEHTRVLESGLATEYTDEIKAQIANSN